VGGMWRGGWWLGGMGMGGMGIGGMGMGGMGMGGMGCGGLAAPEYGANLATLDPFPGMGVSYLVAFLQTLTDG